MMKPPTYLQKIRRTRKSKPLIQRDSAHRRGYGRAWRKQRLNHLRSYPVCVGCGNPATEVDHIQAMSAGGSKYDTNLQSFCKSCHSKKTVQQDGGLGKQRGVGVG